MCNNRKHRGEVEGMEEMEVATVAVERVVAREAVAREVARAEERESAVGGTAAAWEAEMAAAKTEATTGVLQVEVAVTEESTERVAMPVEALLECHSLPSTEHWSQECSSRLRMRVGNRRDMWNHCNLLGGW